MLRLMSRGDRDDLFSYFLNRCAEIEEKIARQNRVIDFLVREARRQSELTELRSDRFESDLDAAHGVERERGRG